MTTTCEEFVVIDFDAVTCHLAPGHDGMHEMSGESETSDGSVHDTPTASR